MRGNKKGVSPVIATVILIAIVIVIGLTIFLWFQGFQKDNIEKLGQNIKLVCDQVSFDASYSSQTIFISNKGNIPIYSFMVQFVSGGSHESQDIRDLTSDFPEMGIGKEETFSEYFSDKGADNLVLIPILLGTSDGEQITHQCDEETGEEINIS